MPAHMSGATGSPALPSETPVTDRAAFRQLLASIRFQR
jgi:hypothetical protein